jgi:hypothetical protein
MRVLPLAIGSTLFAMAGLSQAATVLIDDFETVPGSTDGTGDFDPLPNNNPHGTDPNGPITEDTPEGIQVRTSALAPGPAQGNQYLRILRGGSGGSNRFLPFLSPGIPNTNDFTVTFWLYHASGTGLDLQVGRVNSGTGPNIGFSNMRWVGGEIQRVAHIDEFPVSGWTTVTNFPSEQWEHIGLEYEASGTIGGTYNLYINDFSTPAVSNLQVNNSGFSPPLNNVYFGTRDGAGEIYIDGIEVFEGPIPEPPPPAIIAVDVDSEFGLEFSSETSTLYGLEFTTDLVSSSNYQRTGALLEGNGGSMQIFDPTGFSTSKAYRVSIE